MNQRIAFLARVALRFFVPVFTLCLALFFLFALATFSATDPSPWCDVAAVDGVHIMNAGGSIGAFSAATLYVLFGYGAWFFALFLFSFGWYLFRRVYLQQQIVDGESVRRCDAGRCCGWLLTLAGFVALCAPITLISLFGVSAGGRCGEIFSASLHTLFDDWMAPTGAAVLMAAGLVLLLRFSWVSYVVLGLRFGGRAAKDLWQRVRKDQPMQAAQPLEVKDKIYVDPVWQQMGGDVVQISEEPSDVLPSLSFFKASATHEKNEAAQDAVHWSEKLETVLHRHGIPGKVVAQRRGPVVTLFEYAPGPSVKVAQVAVLEDDVALALGVLSVRIIAPIPGKTVIGIELANESRETVFLADIVHRAELPLKGALPLVIGSDTAGQDVIVDLATLPHLLVAGSTGAGKSVALNTMLTGLLCSKTPEELRLVLVDPKRLEFASYADVPHLLFPVVTEVLQVPRVLQWLVAEMEDRYQRLASAGARQIADYRDGAMPHLVVVIDELADIVMTVGRDVEPLLARLAQMARAAGIHLVIATQRPSVDVITGLIKVNFPARIAFKVASKIDSRTILDAPGAERLLGKGDLLFLTSRGGIERYHGAFVRDDEIAAVVAHWKVKMPVVYESLELVNQKQLSADEIDPLYQDVVSFVRSVDEVSISLVQRRFRIGFNRSARLIETLAEQGILAADRRGKYRKVVRDLHLS